MAPLTLNVRTMPVGLANPNMFGALPAAGALAAIASIATGAQAMTDAQTNRVGGMVTSYGLGLWRAGQSVRAFVGRRTRPSGRRKLYGVPARDLESRIADLEPVLSRVPPETHGRTARPHARSGRVSCRSNPAPARGLRATRIMVTASPRP